MKNLVTYIKEGFASEYLVQYFDGQNQATSFKTLAQAREFVKNKPEITYWDITHGDNSSDEKNLIEWYGEGGFWYNFCYNPVFSQNRQEKAAAERAKNKEVKE